MKVFLKELGYTLIAIAFIAFVAFWPYSGLVVLMFFAGLFGA